jgi:CHAT domain-containing protein/Tfp pilus assembly protein PilF
MKALIGALVCLVTFVPVAAETPSLDQLADLMAEGEYAEAELGARELLAELEAEHGAGSVELAPVLDVLVESMWRGGKATEPETRALGVRGLEIKRKQLGPEDASVGKSLHHLAIVAYFNGEFDQARAQWEDAIRIRETALGPDHPDVAESANGLANLCQTTGAFKEAIELYARAARIREQSFGSDDPRVGHTLNNLASLMVVTGRYAEALPVAERSLEIKEATFGPDHEEIGVGLLALADILEATGEVERAREATERVLAIWEKSLGPNHPQVGDAANNLAEYARREEEWEKAESLYRRALSVYRRVDGDKHPGVPVALNNLGTVLARTGRLDEALQLQQMSVTLREVRLGAEHPAVAQSLEGLGEIQLKLGKSDEALKAYDRCAAIRRTSFGDDNPDTATCIAGLARSKAASGDRDAALALALESERIARDHLRLTGRALSEEHALRYAATRDRGLDLALSLATAGANGGEDVLDTLVRSRAVILDEIAARQRKAVSGDPRTAKLVEELVAARTRLANLTVRGLNHLDAEEYREYVEQARAEKDQAERALAAASAEFAGERRRSRLGLSEVADAMPGGSALVAFVLYEHTRLPSAADEARYEEPVPSYAALVLRRGERSPVVVALGDAGPLESRVADWKKAAAQGAPDLRRTAEQADAQYREAGGALAEALWTPLAPHLENVERVFIVPDGSINLVSFAALPVGESRYLIDDGPVVHYLSAERDLVPVEGDVGEGLLAIGGPDYDDTSLFASLAGSTGPAATPAMSGTRQSACGTFRDLKFAPLPAAEREVGEIVAIWDESRRSKSVEAPSLSLSGRAASEAAFKTSVQNRRILHVATHGFFLGGECAAGASTRGFKIVTEEKPEPIAPNVRLSPLLLSGLALAGANNREASAEDEEDGILTAEEVASLDLSGVEWAVLSACDTGVGEIQAGEGVSGLRRAVQVAGVRTLIMSLWPVDDEATRQWMGALYRGRLLDGLDSSAAVRGAGAAVLQARREAGESDHPYYWAAFVAAGDWR